MDRSGTIQDSDIQDKRFQCNQSNTDSSNHWKHPEDPGPKLSWMNLVSFQRNNQSSWDSPVRRQWGTFPRSCSTAAVLGDSTPPVVTNGGEVLQTSWMQNQLTENPDPDPDPISVWSDPDRQWVKINQLSLILGCPLVAGRSLTAKPTLNWTELNWRLYWFKRDLAQII